MLLRPAEAVAETSARAFGEAAAARDELHRTIVELTLVVDPDVSSLQVSEQERSLPLGSRVRLPERGSPGHSLDYAIALERAGKHRKALDHLYRLLDDLLQDDKIAECDDLLRQADVRRMNTFLLVGLLTITLPFREVLPARAEMFGRVRTRLQELAPDRVDRLLAGLQ